MVTIPPDLYAAAPVQYRTTMGHGYCIIKAISLNHNKAARYLPNLHKRPVRDKSARFEHLTGQIKPNAIVD
jgi:hypothetical protein